MCRAVTATRERDMRRFDDNMVDVLPQSPVLTEQRYCDLPFRDFLDVNHELSLVTLDPVGHLQDSDNTPSLTVTTTSHTLT